MRTHAVNKRLARLDRQLDDVITFERILASRAWQDVQRALVEALEPYPEVRAALHARFAAQAEQEREQRR